MNNNTTPHEPAGGDFPLTVIFLGSLPFATFGGLIGYVIVVVILMGIFCLFKLAIDENFRREIGTAVLGVLGIVGCLLLPKLVLEMLPEKLQAEPAFWIACTLFLLLMLGIAATVCTMRQEEQKRLEDEAFKRAWPNVTRLDPAEEDRKKMARYEAIGRAMHESVVTGKRPMI